MRNQSMGLMRGVLRGATADGADFTDARLMRADLEFGSFRGARFAGADLSRATPRRRRPDRRRRDRGALRGADSPRPG